MGEARGKALAEIALASSGIARLNSGENPLCSSVEMKQLGALRRAVGRGELLLRHPVGDPLDDRRPLRQPGAVVELQHRHVAQRIDLPEIAAAFQVLVLVSVLTLSKARPASLRTTLAITAKGRTLRRAMWPAYAAVLEKRFGARLSQAEAEQLVRLLSKVAPA